LRLLHVPRSWHELIINMGSVTWWDVQLKVSVFLFETVIGKKTKAMLGRECVGPPADVCLDSSFFKVHAVGLTHLGPEQRPARK